MNWLASFPGPAQLSVVQVTESWAEPGNVMQAAESWAEPENVLQAAESWAEPGNVLQATESWAEPGNGAMNWWEVGDEESITKEFKSQKGI